MWTARGTLRSCWQQIVELGKLWVCSCPKVTSRTQPHRCPETCANAAGAHSCTPFCCSGSNVDVKDTRGCNFLHLAILQPKGLKNIPEEVLQVRLSYVSLLWAIWLSRKKDVNGWTECDVSLMNTETRCSQISKKNLWTTIQTSKTSQRAKWSDSIIIKSLVSSRCLRLQHNSVKALLICEDNEGCTPLHYACRLGIHDSVKNMLGLFGKDGLAYKSKDKKSALHFAAQWVPRSRLFLSTLTQMCLRYFCLLKLVPGAVTADDNGCCDMQCYGKRSSF